MRRWLLSIALLLVPAAAFANCGPTPILDGGGVSTNTKTALDGSSNCFGFVGLVDSGGANATPVAAALASGMTNPTTILFGSMNMLYNGTTWDRWASASTGVPKMDLTSVGATAVVTAGISGTLAIGGNQATNTVVSTNTNPVPIAGSDYGGTAKIQSWKVDSSGFGHVVLESGTNVAQDTNLKNYGGNAVASAGLNGLLAVGGAAANGASVSGNPLQDGGRAQNAEITAVTNGQQVAAAYDLVGKVITMPFANKENFLSGDSGAVTTATNTSVITAQAAGVKIYLTGFSCSNTGSTSSLVKFTSGSGGSLIWQGMNPAGSGITGQIVPPVATAAATALFLTTGSASTSQECTVTGYKGT